MFYFKVVDPSTVDPDEWCRTEDFKQRISARGVYYSSYKNLLHFEALVRMHLTRLLQKRIGSNPAGPRSPTLLEVIAALITLFRGMRSLRKSRHELRHITRAIAKLDGAVTQRYAELGNLPLNDPSVPEQVRNHVAIGLARDFDTYSEVLQRHILPFSNRAIRAILRYIEAFGVLRVTGRGSAQLRYMTINVERLADIHTWVRDRIDGMNKTLGRLVKVNLQLRKAKHSCLLVNALLLEELDRNSSLAKEFLNLLEDSR